MKADFRNFLFAIWKHLRLPDPTAIQYDIAKELQYGHDRLIIEAFRGAGKSWITAAFVLWLLYKNPQFRILVVSANKDRSGQFVRFCKDLITQVPFLKHLVPARDQRWAADSFDVKPAGPDQNPSCRAAGITGQITGFRGDYIIADDVEIPKNTLTEGQREKLAELVKEFDAVFKEGGKVIYLGTPQCEFSLYNTLQKRGYKAKVWPARIPDEDQQDYYGHLLGDHIKNLIYVDRLPVGSPTEPMRFGDESLLSRELSYGRSGFNLQFMLDSRLSDKLKYPLKLADLIVMATNDELAPEKPVWASSVDLVYNDLPTIGMEGDRFYRPMAINGDWIPYGGSVLTLDPSGKGHDETGYAVTKFLNGYVYAVDVGGFLGGYGDEVFEQITKIAKKHQVNKIIIEKNFGDGMYAELLKKWLLANGEDQYAVSIEEVHSTGQKELRIIDVMEPLMNQHRLVINESVIKKDWESLSQYPKDSSHGYSLFYQLTRLTKDRGSLGHDDRLEALSMGCAYWTTQVSLDADKAIEKRKEDILEEEYQKYMQLAKRNGYQTGSHRRTWAGVRTR